MKQRECQHQIFRRCAMQRCTFAELHGISHSKVHHHASLSIENNWMDEANPWSQCCERNSLSNKGIFMIFLSQENTVVAKIIHWTSNFLCSTVTMEFPGPFNDFLLRVDPHKGRNDPSIVVIHDSLDQYPMPINPDQCRSKSWHWSEMVLNADHCRSILINSSQCWSWHWSALIGIDRNWLTLGSMPQFWPAMGIDRGSPEQ